MDLQNLEIHTVTSTESPEFGHLTQSLTRSSVIGLDAEWRPVRGHQSSFPTVSLLQLACRLGADSDESVVFLLDLLSIDLPSVWELLRDVFVSPRVLKLGFRFKQDLVYLSSTFCANGCDPGFDRVEPFLDITSIYNHLQHKQPGKRMAKEIKSLTTICQEILGFSLSKELQCSDWSHRPLSEGQKTYAAMDAHCLLEIFSFFQVKVVKEDTFHRKTEVNSQYANLGLKVVLEEAEICKKISTIKVKAIDIFLATVASDCHPRMNTVDDIVSNSPCANIIPMEKSLCKIVTKYGETILLKESDKKPKAPKRKGRKRSAASVIRRQKLSEISCDWQGPLPWDLSLGGDGCPKFLCDVMVEGLAKHLRCVGIDAAVPLVRKPDTRELIDQAHKEKRVLLTRDAKLLRHEYLIENQIYRVKSLLKNEQLLEVIETFQLKINEYELLSRCTKCNGQFIEKPLNTKEAVEAAKGFQKIPNCLFDKNLEFWQCQDCNQLYWQGTQYHNAVQKFTDFCKLND